MSSAPRASFRSPRVRSLLVALAVAACSSFAPTARAQVVMDDSLASVSAITGPAYAVNATHGVVAGDTLYLSFATLDVNTGETLTITGPANVEHVVIRVTGAAAAQFDGAVTLDIDGASLIIESALGMTIGEAGTFTVPADLVLTSADYVRASSGDRFQAPPIASEEVPDTAPAHLGFLAGTHGTIVITDATLELTGDLRIVGGTVTITGATLEAEHVALIGATQGEVALATLDISSMTGAGIIALADVTVDSDDDAFVHPTGCGNGWVDDGEACDDGVAMSATDPDACRPGCIAPRCGDSIQDSNEECDNGTSNSNTVVDACRTNCRDAGCGDDIIDSGEVCDDGPMNSDTEAEACLTTCAYAVCGNSVVESVEECDDGTGNLSDTEPDTCRTNCRAARCGDDVIDTGEECDDGADNSAGAADACRDDCRLPSCGDRVVDTGEFCDDGPFNSDETPGRCRVDCQSENGPLELIGGACEVPRTPEGEWPLGAFVLAAVAILVPLRRRLS